MGKSVDNEDLGDSWLQLVPDILSAIPVGDGTLKARSRPPQSRCVMLGAALGATAEQSAVDEMVVVLAAQRQCSLKSAIGTGVMASTMAR